MSKVSQVVRSPASSLGFCHSFGFRHSSFGFVKSGSWVEPLRCFEVANRRAGKAFFGAMKRIGLPLLLLFISQHPACAGTLAQFRTVFGDMEVELYGQDKPATVGNFIRYVRGGLYTNMFCHRYVPGFVIQGGG